MEEIEKVVLRKATTLFIEYSNCGLRFSSSYLAKVGIGLELQFLNRIQYIVWGWFLVEKSDNKIISKIQRYIILQEYECICINEQLNNKQLLSISDFLF